MDVVAPPLSLKKVITVLDPKPGPPKGGGFRVENRFHEKGGGGFRVENRYHCVQVHFMGVHARVFCLVSCAFT